jgi:hypothetical protein
VEFEHRIGKQRQPETQDGERAFELVVLQRRGNIAIDGVPGKVLE